MIVETLEKRQDQALKRLHRLSKENRDLAVFEARRNLREAKIIDAHDRLMKPYDRSSCTRG